MWRQVWYPGSDALLCAVYSLASSFIGASSVVFVSLGACGLRSRLITGGLIAGTTVGCWLRFFTLALRAACLPVYAIILNIC